MEVVKYCFLMESRVKVLNLDTAAFLWNYFRFQ